MAKIATPATTQKMIEQVGTISANSDSRIGKLIAAAISKVGNRGVITVTEGTGFEDSLEVLEGMQFDRGVLMPIFLNQSTMKCEMRDAFVLLIDGKVNTMRELVPILEQVSKTKRSIVVIAEDYENEAVTTMMTNKLRGLIDICPIRSPGFGTGRVEQLKDLASVTGGQIVSTESGITLEDIKLDQLGQAQNVTIDLANTTIVGGAGTEEQIARRVEEITASLQVAQSSFDRDKMQERIAKLTSGVAY